jgi:hypothetical protein
MPHASPRDPNRSAPGGASSDDAEACATNALGGDALPVFVPRALVFFGAIWALAAWLYLYGTKPPLQSQAASYAPSMQLFVTMLAVGISVGWPLLRLAGPPSSAPARQSAIDAVALFTLAQIIVWPLRLVTTWTIPRTIAIDCALAASIASVAAVLALALGAGSRRVRTATLAGIVVAVLLPGALAAAAQAVGWNPDLAAHPVVLACSPPALLSTVAAPDPVDPGEPARVATVVAMGLAAALWGCVGVRAMVRGPA